MKDESDKRSAARRFDDEISAVIDNVDEGLTIAEMVGILELQVHVLKCRFYPGKPPPPASSND